MTTTGDHATDPTALHRDLLAAIRDALDVPLPADGVDRRHYEWLQRDRAQAVHAITEAVLADACTGCLKAATNVLRDRTRQLPVTYRRHIATAQDHPDDCQVCGPDCCSPVLGIHSSSPGPHAGAAVAGVR
jgi:hypothetical protein